MQMYRVKFARKITDSMIDLGDVLVCAKTQDEALIMVATVVALPVSDTEFEVTRVKPSFFQISRKRVDNSLSTYEAQTVDSSLASTATFPGVTETMIFKEWYSLVASADIKAENENDAINGLAQAISREMSGEKQTSSVRDLDIVCNIRNAGARTAAVEENALYTHRRIFQGGDTRT